MENTRGLVFAPRTSRALLGRPSMMGVKDRPSGPRTGRRAQPPGLLEESTHIGCMLGVSTAGEIRCGILWTL